MSNIPKQCYVTVNGADKKQTMAGFGVNINSKYWGDRLMPVMNLLTDELGAKLYRLDVFGMSNWIDEDGTLGKEKAFSQENLDKVYSGKFAQNGAAMLRHLNSKGIEPYITCSGDVPRWMNGDDGVTLQDYESFTDMLITFIDWIRNKEKIKFSLFCPLNETDIGQPEGPFVNPEEYVKVCQLLDAKLTQKGWDEIKFVVSEQANYDASYVNAFTACEALAKRVAVFGMHQYFDYTPEKYAWVSNALTGAYADKQMWMTEYGDLDQTGEKEWYIAWKSVERAIDFVKAGYHGGLQWDAYDNHHDHDDMWTIYGLIRYARYVATPKKRFYGNKHLYRYVQPGFIHVGMQNTQDDWRVNNDGVIHNDLKIAAFTSPCGYEISVVGMNTGTAPIELEIHFADLPEILKKSHLHLFLTTEKDSCVQRPNLRFNDLYGGAWTKDRESVVFVAPPESIFTVTSMQ